MVHFLPFFPALTVFFREVAEHIKAEMEVERSSGLFSVHALANLSTTLYFESFTEDKLSRFVYGKDHKSNQGQVVIVGDSGLFLFFSFIFPPQFFFVPYNFAITG